jgi:hypothetical protein
LLDKGVLQRGKDEGRRDRPRYAQPSGAVKGNLINQRLRMLVDPHGLAAERCSCGAGVHT